jgi:hypothetical protein
MQEETPLAPAQIIVSLILLPQTCLQSVVDTRGRAACCNLSGVLLAAGIEGQSQGPCRPLRATPWNLESDCVPPSPRSAAPVVWVGGDLCSQQGTGTGLLPSSPFLLLLSVKGENQGPHSELSPGQQNFGLWRKKMRLGVRG